MLFVGHESYCPMILVDVVLYTEDNIVRRNTNILSKTSSGTDELHDIKKCCGSSLIHFICRKKSIIMKSDEIEEFHGRYSHVSVHFEHYILVFSGRDLNHQSCSHHTIWMHNLYTKEWRACELSKSEIAPPPTAGACAVRVGEAVYMFGGIRLNKAPGLSAYYNDVWQLGRSQDGLFFWCKIKIIDSAKMPSPRVDHSGWEYDGMVWTFGGHGDPSVGFLNDHGDFTDHNPLVTFNNQLLCFNPSSDEWMVLKCFGSVPRPRSQHSTTILRDKVWMYGGHDLTRITARFNELYHLSMRSFEWTQIQTGNPQGLFFSSLTAISDTMLLLHGENQVSTTSESWVIDLLTQTWKQYTREKDPPRLHHTGHTSINNNVIIIGGSNRSYDCTATFYVMLEPRSLQQLTMQIIFKHKDVLPLKYLPKTLTTRLGIAEIE